MTIKYIRSDGGGVQTHRMKKQTYNDIVAEFGGIVNYLESILSCRVEQVTIIEQSRRLKW